MSNFLPLNTYTLFQIPQITYFNFYWIIPLILRYECAENRPIIPIDQSFLIILIISITIWSYTLEKNCKINSSEDTFQWGIGNHLKFLFQNHWSYWNRNRVDQAYPKLKFRSRIFIFYFLLKNCGCKCQKGAQLLKKLKNGVLLNIKVW